MKVFGLTEIHVIDGKVDFSENTHVIAESIMPARNARMKSIRRDILPNPNIENHQVSFKLKIQKSKMFS